MVPTKPCIIPRLLSEVPERDFLKRISSVLLQFISCPTKESGWSCASSSSSSSSSSSLLRSSASSIFDGEYESLTVETFICTLLKSKLFSKECLVIALIYADRLFQSDPSFVLSQRNIHRFLLVSVLVASKIVDDYNCRNALYAPLLNLTKSKLNDLELNFCFMLKFDLNVTPDEYLLYYESFLLMPLTVEVTPSELIPMASCPTMPWEELRPMDVFDGFMERQTRYLNEVCDDGFFEPYQVVPCVPSSPVLCADVSGFKSSRATLTLSSSLRSHQAPFNASHDLAASQCPSSPGESHLDAPYSCLPFDRLPSFSPVLVKQCPFPSAPFPSPASHFTAPPRVSFPRPDFYPPPLHPLPYMYAGRPAQIPVAPLMAPYPPPHVQTSGYPVFPLPMGPVHCTSDSFVPLMPAVWFGAPFPHCASLTA